MEHRHGARFPVDLMVSLEQNNRPLGVFLTGDVSYGGLSIRGRDASLKNNSIVKVTIFMKKLPIKVFKAMVIHQHKDRIGLMFVDGKGISLPTLLKLNDQVGELAVSV